MDITTIILAFVAGLVSFLSPCALPLVPAYLTFLAGSSLQEANSPEMRKKIFLNSVFFVLGFAAVFSLLGVLLQSFLSGVAYSVQTDLGYVGGTLIIVFGLMMMGIIDLPALNRDYKLNIRQVRASYLTSFLFGSAFAVGWTPCVGAILGSILALAATQPGTAFPLMVSYSLGLGVPFLIVGLFVSRASAVIKSLMPYLRWLNLVFGFVLVVLGILIFTQTLPSVADLSFLNNFLLK